jgi:hypothetical protein
MLVKAANSSTRRLVGVVGDFRYLRFVVHANKRVTGSGKNNEVWFSPTLQAAACQRWLLSLCSASESANRRAPTNQSPSGNLDLWA